MQTKLKITLQNLNPGLYFFEKKTTFHFDDFQEKFVKTDVFYIHKHLRGPKKRVRKTEVRKNPVRKNRGSLNALLR